MRRRCPPGSWTSGSPLLAVDRLFQRSAATPLVTLEVRCPLQVRDRPYAEPGDGPNGAGDAEQLCNEGLAVERDPTDTKALGGRREPQVLDSQASRVQAGVVDGMTSEHAWLATVGVVGHDDAETRFQDAVD